MFVLGLQNSSVAFVPLFQMCDRLPLFTYRDICNRLSSTVYGSDVLNNISRI